MLSEKFYKAVRTNGVSTGRRAVGEVALARRSFWHGKHHGFGNYFLLIALDCHKAC